MITMKMHEYGYSENKRMSTITLECILDHRKGDLKGISLFHSFSVVMSLSSVLTDYCYHYLVVIIINNQTTFSGIE